MLFKTAFRNIFRYFRRSIVIFLCLLFSLITLQISDSISEGFKKQVKILMLKNAGMLLIKSQNDDPLDFASGGIKNFSELKKKIEEIIKDAEVIPEITAPAIAVKDTLSTNVLLLGTNAPVIVNSLTARNLDASTGDTIILLGTNSYGGMSIIQVVVDSILRGDSKPSGNITIPLKDMQSFLAWGDDQVKTVKVNFEEFTKADSFAGILSNLFPGLEISPWNERLKNLESLFRTSDVKMYIFSLIILLVVAGIIMNSVLSSVMERRKDLGTLRAIGASRTFILIMIIAEVFLLTIFASIFGVCLAFYFTSKLSETGIHYGQTIKQIAEFMPEVLYPRINPLRWTFDVIFLFFWAFIWSLYPALLIARMEPVRALREEL